MKPRKIKSGRKADLASNLELIGLPFRNRLGFGMLESVIGGGMVVMAVLSTSVVFKEIATSKSNGGFISLVSAVESSLTAALLNENPYKDPNVKSFLRQGKVPADLKFQVQGDSQGKKFNFEMSPNSAVAMSSKTFETCPGFPSADCDIKLHLAVTTSTGQVAYAYKFEFHVDDNKSLLNYYGSGSSTANGFSTEDFSLPIPREFIYSSLELACPVNSVGVRGVNRDLGQVGCIYQATQSCPAGTLPKSLVFNPTTNSLEFVCSGPTQSVGCPAKYVLEWIDTTSLDPNRAKSGRCVYEKAASVTGAPVGPAPIISGHLCPADYRSQSSCVLTNVVPVNGHCPPAAPNPPVPGYANLSEDMAGNVTCSVVVPAQTCGAQWNADVILTPRCVLAIPEYVGVL